MLSGLRNAEENDRGAVEGEGRGGDPGCHFLEAAIATKNGLQLCFDPKK